MSINKQLSNFFENRSKILLYKLQKKIICYLQRNVNTDNEISTICDFLKKSNENGHSHRK